MFERAITIEDVSRVLRHGEVIEDYLLPLFPSDVLTSLLHPSDLGGVAISWLTAEARAVASCLGGLGCAAESYVLPLGVLTWAGGAAVDTGCAHSDYK
jgi:hypothetical protein